MPLRPLHLSRQKMAALIFPAPTLTTRPLAAAKLSASNNNLLTAHLAAGRPTRPHTSTLFGYGKKTRTRTKSPIRQLLILNRWQPSVHHLRTSRITRRWLHLTPNLSMLPPPPVATVMAVSPPLAAAAPAVSSPTPPAAP